MNSSPDRWFPAASEAIDGRVLGREMCLLTAAVAEISMGLTQSLFLGKVD